MRRLGRATQRQSRHKQSRTRPLRLLNHPRPRMCHHTYTLTRLFPHRTVTRRVRPTCRMPMALIRYPTSHFPSPLVQFQKRAKRNAFDIVSSVALKTARAKAAGTFAQMLVRTVGTWSAKGGTVNARTRLVEMRGHE